MKTIVVYKTKSGKIDGFSFRFVDKTVKEATEAINNERKNSTFDSDTFEVLEISDFLFEFIQFCLEDRIDYSLKQSDKTERYVIVDMSDMMLVTSRLFDSEMSALEWCYENTFSDADTFKIFKIIE